jgi:hypothetical protein
VHRAPLLRRIRPQLTLKVQKAEHYMLCVRVKMRSGAYASSRQDTDYAEAGGGQEFMGAVQYSRSGCPDLHVYRSRFQPLPYVLGPLGCRVPAPRLQEHSRCLSGALERVAEGRQRNRGFFSDLVRGVSNPREGSKILTFLFRSRLVCSSLLHFLSSWMVDSQKFAEIGLGEPYS